MIKAMGRGGWVAPLVRGLGCEVRVEILLTIAATPPRISVSELAEITELDMPTVSSHLRALREAGLVEYDRQKQLHLYRLAAGISVSEGVLHIPIGDAGEVRLQVADTQSGSKMAG